MLRLSKFFGLLLSGVVTLEGPDDRGDLLLSVGTNNQFDDLARGRLSRLAQGNLPALIQYQNAIRNRKEVFQVIAANDDGNVLR